MTPAPDLVRRYSEPHRAYHTMQHIEECLAEFEKSRHLAADPAAVERALLYHDAVYDPMRHDNEEQSAKLAIAGLDPATARRVEQLILATKHNAVPVDPDAQLVVDIDLSILGQPWERFAEYEVQIRREYAFVPEAIFKPKRAEILGSFVARPSIYSTSFFRDRYEKSARANLARTLKA